MIRNDRRKVWRLLAAVALSGILLATLTPIPGASARSALTPLFCLVCGDIGAVDVLYNLLLFLPLGLTLRLAGMRGVTVVALAALTTLSVESAQYWIVPGRDTSLSDLLTNTAGGTLGMLLADTRALLLRPAGRPLASLLALAALVPTVILAGSAWLLRPAPPHSVWYGQWAPDLGQYERFRGRILTASLGGMSLPSGPLRAAEQRPFELRATFVTGPPPAGLAPIVSVFDEHQRKVILLGQAEGDLHFEARIRGENYRFRPLALGLADVFPAEAGDTLSAAGSYDGKTLRMELQNAPTVRKRELRVSPALGWALVTPWFGPLGSLARTLSTLWLLILWTPLGFYSGRAVRSHRVLALIVFGALLLTTTVTLLAGLPLNHWSEWFGTMLGFSVGYGLNRALQDPVYPQLPKVQRGSGGWNG